MGKAGAKTLKEQVEKLHRLLGGMEDLLDSGFFISVLGKIVVDEKRAFEILNGLRALDFGVEPDVKTLAAAGTGPGRAPENADEHIRRAYAEAQNIRRGADEYALKTMLDLGASLEKMLGSINEGVRVLDSRLEKYKGLASDEAKRVADNGGM